MTDTELFEIVKGHREAWPDHFVYGEWDGFGLRNSLEVCGHGDTRPRRIDTRTAELGLEAQFHRALLQRGDVYTHHIGGTYTVQTGDHDFTGGSLIEAYAAALEYRK